MSRRFRPAVVLALAALLISSAGILWVAVLSPQEPVAPPVIHELLPTVPGPDGSGTVTETLANATGVIGPSPPTELTFHGSVMLGNEVYLTINASRPSYWRLTAFETYEGTRWLRDPQLTAIDQGAPTDPTGPSGTLLVQRVGVETGTHYALAGAWRPFRAWLNWTEPVNTNWSLGKDSSDGLVALQALVPGSHYTLISSVLEPSPAELLAAGIPSVGAERYLALPDSLPERVRSLADNLTTGLTSTYARLQALKIFLEGNVSFSLAISPPPPSVDLVDWFLFEERRGYGPYFASALAVLGRAAGVPTRLAVGYLPGILLPEEGLFVVGSRHAHAWVEAWLEGPGWVRLDPTPADPEGTAPGPLPEPPAALPRRIPTVTVVTALPQAVLPEEGFAVLGTVRSRGGWPVAGSDIGISLNTSKQLAGVAIGSGRTAPNGTFVVSASVGAANLRGAFDLVAHSEGTLVFAASWSDPVLRVLKPTYLTLTFGYPAMPPLLHGLLLDEELRPVAGVTVDVLVNRVVHSMAATDSAGGFLLDLSGFLSENGTSLEVAAAYGGDATRLLLGPSLADVSLNISRALPVIALTPLAPVVSVQDPSVEVAVNLTVDGQPASNFPFSLRDRRTNLSLGAFTTDLLGQAVIGLPVPPLAELGAHLLQAEVAPSIQLNGAVGVASYDLVAPTHLELDPGPNRTSLADPYLLTGQLTALQTPVVNGEVEVRLIGGLGPELASGRTDTAGRFKILIPLSSIGEPGRVLFTARFADPSLETRYLPSEAVFELFLFVPIRLSFVSFPPQVLHGDAAAFRLAVEPLRSAVATGALDAVVDETVLANATLQPGDSALALNFSTEELTVDDHLLRFRFWPDSALLGRVERATTLRIVAPVELTLQASSRRIVPGGGTDLVGTLSSEGRGLAFFPVSLVLIVEATEEPLAQIGTDEEGRFSYHWSPPETVRGAVEVVALHESQSNYLSGASEPLRLLIAPQFWTSPWFVGGMVALAIASVLTVTYGHSLWSAWRSERQMARLPSVPIPDYARPGTNGEVARIYSQALLHLARAGVPFDPAATPSERWQRLVAKADPRAAPLGTLTELFERAFYAPWPLAASQVSDAHQLLETLTKLPGGVLAG